MDLGLGLVLEFGVCDWEFVIRRRVVLSGRLESSLESMRVVERRVTLVSVPRKCASLEDGWIGLGLGLSKSLLRWHAAKHGMADMMQCSGSGHASRCSSASRGRHTHRFSGDSSILPSLDNDAV